MMERRIFGYTLGKRKGLLVELTREDGKRGVGEIAPLPGWSRESVEDALHQIIHGSEEPLFPSVAFGMESALLSLEAPSLPLTLPLCRLLSGTAFEMRKEIERLEEMGVNCVKIKLGHLKRNEALEIVRAAKKSFRLRLDLNRAWPLRESLRFFSHFSEGEYEFVEEPCDKASDLAYFPYPFGADESLRETPISEILELPSLKALIYKPTLQGGLEVAQRLVEAARARKIDLIFSSAFESGVGISQIALLAHHLDLTKIPLGLDTYRFLTGDLLQKPLHFSPNALQLREPLFEINPCAVQLLHEQTLNPLHLSPMLAR